eukprot:3882097-Pleurochrysis_carterae.AAC.1
MAVTHMTKTHPSLSHFKKLRYIDRCYYSKFSTTASGDSMVWYGSNSSCEDVSLRGPDHPFLGFLV